MEKVTCLQGTFLKGGFSLEGNFTPKLRILYLTEIFYQKTDENHFLTMDEICRYLKNKGFDAERKSIYRDMNLLRDYGLDIEMVHEKKQYGYRLASRRFELAELKLLVDSVQAAHFITPKKSRELIGKLEGLASCYQASQMQYQVYVAERVKSENERILYNIDAIHRAICSNRMISFQYFTWDVNRKMVLRHQGERYLESVWAMTLAEDNYYAICHDEKGIRYFRVDKMTSLDIIESCKRTGEKEFREFDIASYSKKRFHMYDGPVTQVKMCCTTDLAGVVIDRFGKNVILRKTDEDHFSFWADVAVSNQFYGWVFSMAGKMEILEPSFVRDGMRELIKKFI